MARNPFTKIGRPAKTPPNGLRTEIPAKAFRQGGAVAKCHYDDARMSKSSSEMGFKSAQDHFKRGGKC